MTVKNKTNKPKSDFNCQFCKKDFITEKNLIAHSCEKKRRWLWRDEKYIKLGFFAYRKFYIFSMKNSKEKTYQDFMDSKYYTGFTKFGRYLINMNAIDIEGFIEFILKSNTKLELWCSDALYEEWIKNLSKKESPERAVERNILLMVQWERETGIVWQDFFRKVNPQLATIWIKTGRITPWILYSGFGDQLFSRMSDEQLTIVKDLLDPNFWAKKFILNKEEVENIKNHLKSAGV